MVEHMGTVHSQYLLYLEMEKMRGLISSEFSVLFNKQDLIVYGEQPGTLS